ncbi:MAG: InlB B-repeat-containing protein [Clostridia bacterium]|nr:InlB B-repeat-containing protein [Clostridia bacterium]
MKKFLLPFIILFFTMLLFLNISAYEPDVSAEGVVVTVSELEGVRDIFIARGEYLDYRSLKADYIVRLTENKLSGKVSYSYNVGQVGVYTVLFRFNDARADIARYITIDIIEPVLTANGLQYTVSEIEDAKVIRTARGLYNSVTELKRSGNEVRSFTAKDVLRDKSEYTIQYRTNGDYTIAVQYYNGYTKLFHIKVEQKIPTVAEEGSTVIFGNLDGLYNIRYAVGHYNSSQEIKRAEGSVVIRPEAIVDGYITVPDLAEGEYTFCVQYKDESFYYYHTAIEAEYGRIICWGDSLTHGILTAFDNLAEYPYPRRLSQLTGMEVKNYGIGAEAAEAIATRQGGLILAVKPVTIPATKTPVAIELISDLNGTPASIAYYGLAAINPVTIGGIEGEITRNGGQCYFTRTETGKGVTLKGITQVCTYAMNDKRAGDIMVVWAGHNNDYVNGQGDKLISVIDKMIKYHGTDRYIVVGMTAERRAPAYKDINAALSEHYGEHFVDAQPYLADPLRLTELNITPTARDLDYLSKGWTPPSLLAADDLHLNQAGYDIIAELVYKKICELKFPTYSIDRTNKQYTLTLDNGDGSMSVYGINTGDHYYDIIPEYPIPQREGYKFLGWTNGQGYTLRLCDYVYNTYTYRGDTTFTASWQEEVYYSINFDPMGGVMDEGCYTSYPIRNGDYYYQAIPKYPTATKEGYTFKYWWIAEYSFALTEQTFYDCYYAIYKDCTFTAVWEKN